jgi:cytochrome c5
MFRSTAILSAAILGAALSAPAQAADGTAVYNANCAMCHVPGLANSPKFGDKAAWAPRIAMGIDALTASAIKGKGAMPPKGGSAASEAEIKAVVTYMVGAAK